MKTIRTIIATLSAVLLTFALVAWFSVRRNAAFIQRTIYQGFDQTFVVALVMGFAFLLIAIILTVAIVSTEDEDEEDEAPIRSRPRPDAQRRLAAERDEEPYRRVSRARTMDQSRSSRQEDVGFARPRAQSAADAPRARKRERTAQRSDDVAREREDVPVKRERKLPKPAPTLAGDPLDAETVEVPAPPAAAPAPEPARIETVAEPENKPAPEAESPKDEASEAEMEAAEPAKEDTVRCVFCGSVISRDSLFCPRCGKKR